MSARTWQLAAGPITLILIARSFSPIVQGFYYTFASLLALQSFVELGFYIVIINVASHEWSQLALDEKRRIVGDPDALSRLVSLGRLIVKWYAVASTIFVAAVSIGGMRFFAQSSSSASVAWQQPWLALVLITGVQLWVLPLTSLLEGCNQVAEVNRFRFVQVAAGTVALWAAIAMGAALWAAPINAAVRLLCDGTLICVRYRRFFSAFLRSTVGAQLVWRTDVWPMQWRLALSGIVNYFAFSMFNPVMFRYHGPAAAGQMGMTLQAIGGLQALAMVWITTRVPQLGALTAQRDYPALDRLWRRVSTISVTLFALGGLSLLGLVWVLYAWRLPIATRLLPPLPTACLVAAGLLMQVSQCQTAYMRAHKQEPIVVMSVTTSIANAVVVWLFGRQYAALGATTAYLFIMAVVVIWETAIWRRFRSEAVVQPALVAV